MVANSINAQVPVVGGTAVAVQARNPSLLKPGLPTSPGPVLPIMPNRMFWTLVGISTLGSIGNMMGNGALQIALPSIGTAFQVDSGLLSWLPIAQNVIQVGLMLPLGNLGDQIGHRRLYVLGLIGVAICSGLGALAPEFWSLLGTRVLAAIALSMVMAAGPALVANTVPASRRGQALGWTRSSAYVGYALGPLLGGAILTVADWRAAILVGVPLALITTPAVLRWFPERGGGASAPGSFDLLGAVLLTGGLGGLLLALSRGVSWGWVSPASLGALVLGTLLIGLFFQHERLTRRPLLDLGLFRRPGFATATAGAAIIFVGAWAAPFLLPFYLIETRGFSPGLAGLLSAVVPLATMVVTPIAGTLSDRVDGRPLAIAGMGSLTTGLILMGLAGPDAGPFDLGLRLILIGAGVGLFSTPNSSAMLGSVRPEQRGAVNGINSTARYVGQAVGTALAGTVLLSETARLLPMLDTSPARASAVSAAFLVVGAVTAIGLITSCFPVATADPAHHNGRN